MKKLLFIIGLFLIFSGYTFGQISFGIKGGVSSYDMEYKNLLSSSKISGEFKNSHYGVHAGIWARFGLLGLKIQPEIQFNSNNVNFEYTDLENPSNASQIINTSYRNLDFPVLAGIKISFLNIYAGPVGHYFLKDLSEFESGYDIKQEFKTFTYGYQLGGGITIKRLTFDLRYEGGISNDNGKLIYGNQEFILANSPSRLLFSLMLRI
ncbi:MAG: outer membrane beta-barrel protein [Saprospiraceae bacterium]